MNHHKISMFGAALCLLGLGFSDTANGQIVTTPSLATGMSFQVQSGGASSSQNLTINTTGGATTVIVTVPANQTWLKINNAPAGQSFPINTPATIPVTVNTAGFLFGQTVSANVGIVINGAPTTAVNFTVTLTVGTASILTANPTSLSFSGVQGASVGSPNPASVSIASSGAQLVYNISVTTSTGQSWLLLSNTSGTTGSSTFNVYVNPSLLSAGNYTGTIQVQSTTTGDSVTIPVTLSVTVGSTLNVTGTLSNFVYQANSGISNITSQSQQLMVSTTSGSLNYSVSVTSQQTTNWLVVNPNGGTATSTPQAIVLSLSPQYVESLGQGTYTIQLTIAPTGPADSSNTTTETVTLVVSNNPLLNVGTKSLTFSVPFGSSSQSQTVQITSSSGATIPYQVQSNVTWLSVNPSSGTTSANPVINVVVNAQSLAISTTPYTATLTVSPTNGDQYSIAIAVSVTVTGATSQILAGPDQLLFSYQTTGLPPTLPQLVQLTSPSAVGFSVTTSTTTASNCPTTNWLTATPSQNTTPATLSIYVSAGAMTAGSCSGQVIVTYYNGTTTNATVVVPVTVDIAPTALLTVTPPFGFGAYTAASGSGSFTNQISIASTDGSQLQFSAYVSASVTQTPWLSLLGSSVGTTQQYLTVQIAPSGLNVGVYTGSITISANNSANLPSGPLTIPVTLTISANTTVSVSPTSLSFTQAQGATTLPASQQVTLSASGGSVAFSASVSPVTGGTWLQVSPLSGQASGSITASILQNTLTPGTYTSNIILSFVNSATPTATIPVTLTVTGQTAAVSPASLNFTYQLGSAAPATQTLNVTSAGGSIPISVGTTSTTGWLSVTPTTGTSGTSSAPLVLTVTVAPATFTAAGTYSGTITITPASQTPITVAVTVTVTGVPVPQLVTIANSASGQSGAISPGELITIKGVGIGPSTAANFSVGAGNTVSSTLSGVQVLFDNVPGTPTYVSATQINVIVPYEIAGRISTTVVVSYQSVQSSGIPLLVASQAPGIYTFNATGSGQAAVLNQNGTYNGPASGLVINGQNVTTTPAPQGTVIAVFMTGGGQTNPVSTTGTVTPTNILYHIPGTVTATINGVNAPVQFAGAAPGLVTGVVQVNILIPTGVTGNGLPLVINVNGTTTLSGPTVSTQ